MMTPPIRPEIFALCTHSEADMERLTLRQLVDWFKSVMHSGMVMTDLEINYVDKYWMALVQTQARQEGVPVGWLSYSLSQLAQAEKRLMDTATRETAEAINV
jgi:hypothetical protein